MQQMISEMFGDRYVNMDFLDVAFYKNEACTQEFSGTDTIGPATVIYTKISLAEITNGGGGDDPREEYPVEAVGYINGTVSLTGYSGQRVQINVYYYDGEYIPGGPVDGRGSYYDVNSNGSFSIPFTEEFLKALQAGEQYLVFSLLISSGSSQGSNYIKNIEPVPVRASQLIGGNLNMGSLGTVNVDTVTLNGTADITINGQKPDTVFIAAYTEKDNLWDSLIGTTYIEDYARTNTWSMVVETPSPGTTVYFYVDIQTADMFYPPVTLDTTITMPYSGGTIVLKYAGSSDGKPPDGSSDGIPPTDDNNPPPDDRPPTDGGISTGGGMIDSGMPAAAAIKRNR
jgi:hypothetical protein